MVLSLVAALGLSGRLFFLSVLSHTAYVAEAQKQQFVQRTIEARRGDIYVQDVAAGTASLVAQSIERYAVSATPRNVKHKPEYARLLAQFTGNDEQQLLATFRKDGLYMPVLKHGISQEEVKQLEEQINALERGFDDSYVDVKVNFDTAQGNTMYFVGGVFFQREYRRIYTEGALLAQVLGFVNSSGSGQYGFEGQYDDSLKGYSGTLNLEQDSLGTLLKQDSAVEGKNGTDYELSIDRNVQFQVEQELAAAIQNSEAKGGTVIVMDPKTGEIIAMANQPTYDPNNYDKVPTDQISLFTNQAISGSWEPGSIEKPLIMGMALDQGLVTRQTTETFPGSVVVDGHVIETALRKSYGTENMSQVLANSDNVAMVWVANKIGSDTMYRYLKSFGFGDYTGIDLKGEAKGKLLAVNQWRNIHRATISFGQGISVTPLQMATAYAAVANDGKMVRPRIVHALINPDGSRQEMQPTFGEQVLKPETAKVLRTMMVETVLTAHNRAGVNGYKIAGKTGTAQVPNPDSGGYLEDTYNHSFVAIGPSDDPRYVLLVKIDQPNIQKVGIFAESTAVPLAGRLNTFLVNYYQIPPTNR